MALYILLLVCMGLFTIIEKQRGTTFVAENMYGSWWFSALWALLAAASIAYFLRRRVRRLSVVLLHFSFLVILLGALLTHLTASSGVLQLRQGQTTSHYLVLKGNDVSEKSLPFSITLNSFEVKYHEGTAAPADYESVFTITPEDKNGETVEGKVSMNNIFTYGGMRFYQSSFSEDMRGSVLRINSDTWGIPVTYLGYALLFVSLIWMLIDPKGKYRRIIKDAAHNPSAPLLSPLGGMTRLVVVAVFLSSPFFLTPTRAESSPPGGTGGGLTLPSATASKFGKLLINYNNRICPVETFALDFTKKLYGKRSYNGLSADQVLAGFIFYGGQWEGEPILKIKSGAMKDRLQLPDHMSVSQFFNDDMGGYILGPYLSEYYSGQQDKFHQDVMKYDDKLMLVTQLRQGKLLKVFPAPAADGQSVSWYAPTDELPDSMEAGRKDYIQNAFNKLYEYVLASDWKNTDDMIDKMIAYQQRFGGNSVPTKTQLWAEHTYNAIPFATILFMVNLTMAIVLMITSLLQTSPRRGGLPSENVVTRKRLVALKASPAVGGLVGALSFLSLTFCLALRWIVSGTVPMSNGYETMLFMAWVIMLVMLLMCRKFPIMLVFGFLMSGFFLLVSHISQMDPQITHLMPVLSSPLLTIHVSIIMMAFALLSLTFIIGLGNLIASVWHKFVKRTPYGGHEKGALLSQLFLYPAMTCLGLGIFIGAIWANISWGTYWSWDPKETWALITFMVYAVALHYRSLPWLRNPRHYHLFMVIAFLTILMTYFGVNYFLGGMHSYA